MMNELTALEGRIAEVASLCRSLRAENVQLRQQLARIEGERDSLSERMSMARNRLEQLARQLPDAGSPV